MPTEKQYFCCLWRLSPAVHHTHTGVEIPMSMFFIRYDENTYTCVFHLAWKNCRNEVVGTIPVFSTILSDPHSHRYSVWIRTLSQQAKAWVRTGNCFWLHHELPLLHVIAVVAQHFSLQNHILWFYETKTVTQKAGKKPWIAFLIFTHSPRSNRGLLPYLPCCCSL